MIDIQRTFSGHRRSFSDAELCKKLAAEYGFSSVESYKQAILDGGLPSADIEALAEKFREAPHRHGAHLLPKCWCHRGCTSQSMEPMS